MRSSVKDRIIETASQLFYTKGYNLTGINEIIAKAEVAKASLYTHFRSKEDICLAYLRQMDGVFINDLKVFLKKSPKGQKKVLAIFDFLEQFFNQKDFRGCWCLNTMSEIPKDNVRIRKEIVKQKKTLLGFIEEVVLENIEGVDEKEAVLLSRRIYLLYEGALGESHMLNSVWPIQEAKNLLQKIL